MNRRSVILIALLLLVAALALVKYFNHRRPASFHRDVSHIIYTHHARCRMDCRHIDESEVREILEKGTIDYSHSEPNGKPDPKFALEGTTHDGQRVRIVFAEANNGTVVVTVIDLGTEWPCHCN